MLREAQHDIPILKLTHNRVSLSLSKTAILVINQTVKSSGVEMLRQAQDDIKLIFSN
jgi:hypothetical protein